MYKLQEYSCITLKRLLGYYIGKIQEVSFYRKAIRLLRERIEIKEADDKDMAEVHRWFNPNPKIAISYNPDVTNLVAKRGKNIIGFVQLVRRKDNGSLHKGYWLFSLAVKILYRRLGAGEELSRAVIEKARQEGALELSLLVRENDQRAIALYHKLGFKMKVIPDLEEKLKEEKLRYGPRRIVMSKELDASITALN